MKNEMRKKWREGRDKGRWEGREKGKVQNRSPTNF